MKVGKRYFESLAFDQPTTSIDVYGGVEDGWTEVFTTRGHFRYLRGGETVQAGRLEGKQPVVVTIPTSSNARNVTPGWRMRDTQRSVNYNVRSVIVSDDRREMEITCESGVAI